MGSLRGDLDGANGRIGELEAQLGDANMRASGFADLEADSSRVRADLDGAHAHIGELEAQLGDMGSLRGDLDGANGRIAELEAELGQLGALRGDLDGAHTRIGELEGQLAHMGSLQGDLDGARGRIGELEGELAATGALRGDLDGANARIGELEAEMAGSPAAELGQLRVDLAERDRRISALETAARSATVAAPSGPTEDDLALLRADVASRDVRIAELEKQLATPPPAPKEPKAPAATKATAWQKGTTKVGTPGSDHKDDLKAINGIGPKMEGILNDFGIQSWEQLAAFTKADVVKVDAALEDFPGRIERDEWVAQAKAILKNGHKPLDKPAPKPRPKPAWQKGTTKLGTPGAAHKDDLKVVNGIGPVLEKTLNEYGIQSWEQLATFTRKDVSTVDDALSFPGRIDRDEWMKQAKELVKRFPDQKNRPTRATFLNRTDDEDPFS
jgi:NADH-quinone oxidoreductase subunit E